MPFEVGVQFEISFVFQMRERLCTADISSKVLPCDDDDDYSAKTAENKQAPDKRKAEIR